MAPIGTAFSMTASAAVTSSAIARSDRRRPSRVMMATKSVGAGAAAKEEKGFLDYIIGGMFKEEQLLETDPVLNKVEGKAQTTTGTVSSKVVAPAGKSTAGGGGGFSLGGFFAKK